MRAGPNHTPQSGPPDHRRHHPHHTPPACSQNQQYHTIEIKDRDGGVEAVVLTSGYRVMPQWVKIRNVDGFTGSFWEGGVGDAHADVTNDAYTITGSA